MHTYLSYLQCGEHPNCLWVGTELGKGSRKH